MKVTPMTAEARQAFLSQPTVAKLATISRNGEVRMTPIWFRHDPDGSIVFATWMKTAAMRNLKANPRCSVLIDQEQAEPYFGIHLTGTATIEGPANDLEGIAALYAPYKTSLEQARADVAPLIEEGEMTYIRFIPKKEVSWDFRE
jgi:predicted pyridoxine 5'-phosphate oxidase superfamily flavin-nucleotide-binding protein